MKAHEILFIPMFKVDGRLLHCIHLLNMDQICLREMNGKQHVCLRHSKSTCDKLGLSHLVTKGEKACLMHNRDSAIVLISNKSWD